VIVCVLCMLTYERWFVCCVWGIICMCVCVCVCVYSVTLRVCLRVIYVCLCVGYYVYVCVLSVTLRDCLCVTCVCLCMGHYVYVCVMCVIHMSVELLTPHTTSVRDVRVTWMCV